MLAFLVALVKSNFGIAQNPMVISDSLIVQQRLYAKEKLIVDQEAKFKQDIIVLGDARMKSDLRVDSVLRVDGTARFNGNVKMEGLGTLTSLDSTAKIIVHLPNGQLKTVPIGTMATTIYSPPASLDFCGVNSGIPIPPQWWSGINKLFVACPNVNVGIRTDNPQFALHTEGSSYSKNSLVGNSLGSTGAYINAYGLNNTTRLINLGVKIGGLPEELRFSVAANGNIYSKNVGNQPSLIMYNGTGHAIVVHANNGNKILQLEDDGLLRTREVRVDAMTWADFVFDKNYELPKLKEVAKFIELNHRLPGIPSSQEIIENGINVSEMHTLQMQKIEELTLYLIQMDEKIQTMQEEIDQLKAENYSLKQKR